MCCFTGSDKLLKPEGLYACMDMVNTTISMDFLVLSLYCWIPMADCMNKWCRQLYSLPCLIVKYRFNTEPAQIWHLWPLDAHYVPSCEQWAVKTVVMLCGASDGKWDWSHYCSVQQLLPCLLCLLLSLLLGIPCTTPLHRLSGPWRMRCMGWGDALCFRLCTGNSKGECWSPLISWSVLTAVMASLAEYATKLECFKRDEMLPIFI